MDDFFDDSLDPAAADHLRRAARLTDVPAPSPAQRAAAWDRLDAQLSTPRASARRAALGAKTAPRRSISRWWIGAGMTAVLLGAVVWGRMPHRAATTITAARVYTTAPGQQATISLPDGSTVRLRDASRLTVAPGFGHDARTVTVEGEAYFTVVHASGAPFVVRSGAAQARVLGTSFIVRHYAGDSSVRVIVADGKVAVKEASTRDELRDTSRDVGTILTAGMRGDVRMIGPDSGRVAVTSGVMLDDELAWTTERLVFRKTPLGLAIQDLQRHYDVELRFPRTMLEQDSLTAQFASQPLAQVLDALALTFDLRYERHGRVVIFATGARRGTPRTPGLPSTSEVRHGQ